jgi:uncharacterized protein (DUF305 family)
MQSRHRPLALATLAALFLAIVAGQSAAQMPHGQHGAPASAPASTKAYEAAGAKMHRDMAIAYTGNADKDFVAGMIPHHQGAIDAAKVVLQYGKDPELKKLAEEIIAAQSKEIAFLRDWQKRNP